jgi:hypothetical protein
MPQDINPQYGTDPKVDQALALIRLVGSDRILERSGLDDHTMEALKAIRSIDGDAMTHSIPLIEKLWQI